MRWRLFACTSFAFAGVVVACSVKDFLPNISLDAGRGDVFIPYDAGVDTGGPPKTSGCGDRSGLESAAPWPMRGACPRHPGRNGVNGAENAAIRWVYPGSFASSSPIVAADGSIAIGADDDGLVVVSASGSRATGFPIGAPVAATPAIDANETLIFPAQNGSLYGFKSTAGIGPSLDAGPDATPDAGPELDAGTPSFTVALGGAAVASVAIGGDGTIYASANGTLFAIDGSSHATKWTAATNDTMGSSPAVRNDGSVVVGSSDGNVYAFNPDGSKAWSFTTGGPISGSPAVGDDDAVFIGSQDGHIYALNADGSKRYDATTGGPIHGSPALGDDGTLYIGSSDKSLWCLKPDGTVKYQYKTNGEVGSPSIGDGNFAYVGSADRHVYAIDPTGLLFFAVTLDAPGMGPPAIDESGVVYVGTAKGLYAIGP